MRRDRSSTHAHAPTELDSSSSSHYAPPTQHHHPTPPNTTPVSVVEGYDAIKASAEASGEREAGAAGGGGDSGSGGGDDAHAPAPMKRGASFNMAERALKGQQEETLRILALVHRGAGELDPAGITMTASFATCQQLAQVRWVTNALTFRFSS